MVSSGIVSVAIGFDLRASHIAVIASTAASARLAASDGTHLPFVKEIVLCYVKIQFFHKNTSLNNDTLSWLPPILLPVFLLDNKYSILGAVLGMYSMISEIKVCIGIILNGRATYISIVACAITIPLFGAASDSSCFPFSQNLILLKG